MAIGRLFFEFWSYLFNFEVLCFFGEKSARVRRSRTLSALWDQKKEGLELFLEDLGEELAICGRRLETHHHFDNLNFFFLFSHV